MTVGRIVTILVGCVILALITGLITRSIIVGLTFPFLLVVFLLMWNNLKKNNPVEIKQEEKKIEPIPTPQQEVSYPPISTKYPTKV